MSEVEAAMSAIAVALWVAVWAMSPAKVGGDKCNRKDAPLGRTPRP